MSARSEVTNSQPEPLPGRISWALTAEMERRYTPEVICGHIDSLLAATVGGKPDPETGEIVGARPDCRSVESGLKLLLAYSLGLPVQRQEVMIHKVTGPSADDLASDPATIASVRKWLERATRKAGMAEAVEVEEVEETKGD